jgi:hypothetical protein
VHARGAPAAQHLGRPGHHMEPLLPRHRRPPAAVEPRLQAAVLRVVRDQQLQLQHPVGALERQQVRVSHLPLELLA